MIGSTLSHYRITAKLGEGGMGEVFRAEDERLEREVALKVLPDEFVADADRLARFEREAKLLARLNHPNVAAIHEVAEDDGRHFLVMELARGQTLSERLERGPLPVDEVVAVGLQIAAALEAAHERNIVHRDLKPDNIKLDGGGTVKVLDFGLAKALEPEPTELGETPGSMSPTRAFPETEAGVVLGTAPYMSPEQVRGRAVDIRADLWAFGVILFELLTGKSLFGSSTVADTLAAVLHREVDVESLPDGTPAALRRLVRRLLERDLRQRLRHPGDAWLELREARNSVRGHTPVEISEAEEAAASAELESFPLTMEICRQLDRESLVPEMIDDEVVYLDNGRRADVLVVYLPALASDQEQFRDIIERSPYRGLSVCPYGWQENAERRPAIPLADHLTILTAFLHSAVSRIRPRRTVLAGFSSGADLALRLPSESRMEVPSLDGILALGPNLSLDTCFFTSRLASIRTDSSEGMLETLQKMSAATDSVHAWVLLTPYLLNVAKRFHSDVATVRKLAREVVAPFEEEGPSPFAGWYRSVRKKGVAVSALFCNESYDREGLAALRMEHLDSGVLGADFDDDDLVMERDRNHFELLDAELVAERIDELVGRLRDAR